MRCSSKSNCLYISSHLISRLKQNDAQLNGMLSVTSIMGKHFALYVALWSFVGEESGVPIIRQSIVIGYLDTDHISSFGRLKRIGKKKDIWSTIDSYLE